MLEELRRELSSLAGRMERSRKLNSMLAGLREEERSLAARESELLEQLKKEDADVARLERASAASILYTLIGRKLEKLDKERTEAAAARLKYDSVVDQHQQCRARIDELSAELRGLSECAGEYRRVFDKICNEMRHDPEMAERLCSLERELGESKAQLRELEEAIDAGNDCLMQADLLDGMLSSAQGWGTWDVLGGGLIADIAKHSKLDEAQNAAQHLQNLLSRFHSELADVRVDSHVGQVKVEGFLRFADYFFDGLIADWTVLSRIGDSRLSVERVRQQIKDAMSRLYALRTRRASESATLETKISALVSGNM